MSAARPTPAEAKAEARRLRAALAAQGIAISHGQALDRVAQAQGFRDWNALHAAIAHRPPAGLMPGGRVRGRYLGQPFEATVLRATRLRPGWFRLALALDRPVDVVAFESFSNLRRRVRGTVGPEGVSRERTADGRPHLEIEL